MATWIPVPARDDRARTKMRLMHLVSNSATAPGRIRRAGSPPHRQGRDRASSLLPSLARQEEEREMNDTFRAPSSAHLNRRTLLAGAAVSAIGIPGLAQVAPSWLPGKPIHFI